MDRSGKKSGISLALAGALGILFFWLTDPRFGINHAAVRLGPLADPAARDRYYQLIDAANQALIGTVVGICGSVLFLLIGGYLMTRRTA